MPFNIGPHKSSEELYEDAFGYIDKLFPYFSNRGDFFLSNAIEEATEENRVERRPMLDCQYEIGHLLSDLGYVKQGSSGNILHQLTDLGREVKRLGGHKAFLEAKNKAHSQAAQQEQLRFEELELNVQNLRNQFLDYEETKARAKRNEKIAIISIIISIAAVVVAMIKE